MRRGEGVLLASFYCHNSQMADKRQSIPQILQRIQFTLYTCSISIILFSADC